MAKKCKTAFVVCTHNNRGVVEACLRSIHQQTSDDWEAVVIDDASTDGTAEALEAEFPWVRVIRNRVNCGPARLRNVAAADCESEYLAFLDSDVELAPDWLRAVTGALDSRNDLGIVGGKLYYAGRPGRLHAYGGALSRIGIGWNRYDGEDDSGLNAPEECLWVSSAACLVRRSLFERLGGFDPSYFYGYEDSDLGWRCWLAGSAVLCLPNAVAYHRVSESIDRLGSRIVYHYHKNRLRSLLKNLGCGRLVGSLPIWAAYTALDVALRRPRWAKVRAIGWNLGHAAETYRLRRAIQSTRVRTDGEIAHLFARGIVPRKTLQSRRSLGGVGTPAERVRLESGPVD